MDSEQEDSSEKMWRYLYYDVAQTFFLFPISKYMNKITHAESGKNKLLELYSCPC